ncbi:MAG: HyaD/HybD family hydrogenase maturation endopeptidase [Caldimicrobium sp.]
MNKKILILGLGNKLLQDEGLGIKVLEKLDKSYIFSPEVNLLDGGTGAFFLLPYLEEADYLIIIDAIESSEEPGTIYFLDLSKIPENFLEKISLHEVSFQDILNVLKFKGKAFQEIYLAGIVPKSLKLGLELSKEVEEKIEELINLILLKLQEWGISYSLKEEM